MRKSNKIFKKFERKFDRYDTFIYLHGSHSANKKKSRRWARKSFKQNKFYNGFYEFLEYNRKDVK